MRILYLLAIGCATTIPSVALADKANENEAARHQAMANKAQQADANVARQLKSIETQLKQEEHRMNSRLAQLGKMRDAALKKSDQKALDRVEQLEMQAVKQYDTRVTQIIGAAPGKETAAATGNAKLAPVVSRNGQQPAAPVMRAPGKQQTQARNQKQQQQASRAKQNAQNNRKQQRAPKRSKRLKLWPF